MNTPIDYSSRYSFGHFCCRVKQGKRLSEFLQKYTDSGTETTHLAGYNILVFKYVKSLRACLFIGAIHGRSSKIRYCIIWRCLQQQMFQKNETCKALKECYLCYLNHHGRRLDVTTNTYLKSCAYHPDAECCTIFHGNLSNLKSSEDTLLDLYVI